MSIFRRNIEKKYKIDEVSGSPEEVARYLDIGKKGNDLYPVMARHDKIYVIRELTIFDNLFGIRKCDEKTFVFKVREKANSPSETIKNLGLKYTDVLNEYSRVDYEWYINIYAYLTRETAHRALEAYFGSIEKEKKEEEKNKEINSRCLKIHSEEVFV